MIRPLASGLLPVGSLYRIVALVVADDNLHEAVGHCGDVDQLVSPIEASVLNSRIVLPRLCASASHMEWRCCRGYYSVSVLLASYCILYSLCRLSAAQHTQRPSTSLLLGSFVRL